MQDKRNEVASSVQKNGNKGQKGFSWADMGAAMDAKDVQQGIEPQEEDADQRRDEAITGKALLILVENNGFRCAFSGAQMQPDDASIDHLIPLSKGGSHTLSNIAVVHRTVNRMKGEMNGDEFVRWCKLIARWNG